MLYAVISHTESVKYNIIDCLRENNINYVIYQNIILFDSNISQNELTLYFDGKLTRKIDFILISCNDVTGRLTDSVADLLKEIKSVNVKPSNEFDNPKEETIIL